MTRDEVIEIAKQAGLGRMDSEYFTRQIENVVRIAQEREREACAVVAEGTVRKQYKHVNGGRPFTDHMHWEEIAAAIRARGSAAPTVHNPAGIHDEDVS